MGKPHSTLSREIKKPVRKGPITKQKPELVVVKPANLSLGVKKPRVERNKVQENA